MAYIWYIFCLTLSLRTETKKYMHHDGISTKDQRNTDGRG